MNKVLTFDEFIAEQMQDAEFKAEWDALDEEFDALQKMIDAERSGSEAAAV